VKDSARDSEVVALIRRLLKVPDIAPVVPAGEGCDHWAFDVNGAFIARVRKHTDTDTAAAVERETALLDIIARVSPIPVPLVVAAEPEAGLVVFRRLPGYSLLDATPSDPLAFAEPLAEFVGSIHAVPSAVVEHLVGHDDYPLDAYLGEALDHLNTAAAALTGDHRRRVERFLASPAPLEGAALTFCHNDLGAEHVLVSEDRSTLTGIIDWSDAAIADPARDIGLLLRDFGFGVADAVLRRTGGDESTLSRATFYARCALLEDLAYGIEGSRPQYVAHALGRFAETFS
jgi:aminoglycoside phosphotransferase (APT) family kinase protein